MKPLHTLSDQITLSFRKNYLLKNVKGLPGQSRNALIGIGYETLMDLNGKQRHELMRIKCFGAKGWDALVVEYERQGGRALSDLKNQELTIQRAMEVMPKITCPRCKGCGKVAQRRPRAEEALEILKNAGHAPERRF
jgi:hypothetical protein